MTYKGLPDKEQVMAHSAHISDQLVSCKIVLETTARTWEIELTPGPRRPEVSIDVDHNYEEPFAFGLVDRGLIDSNVRLTFDRVVFQSDLTEKEH